MIDLHESLRRSKIIEDEYDECPDCGEEFAGTDSTMAGDFVFVHQESPLETCTVEWDEIKPADENDGSAGGEQDGE